ncbi:type II secretion system F family protein [Nocardioides rubriscoriae]|uniref:type II secretion system F family protein n=1 Tax=Nocardioides rubriscoriae TaxID=642762 RepID=UPI0011E06E1C|nr:type II secretion system F family protein [Nocardioides rubriscoriae]
MVLLFVLGVVLVLFAIVLVSMAFTAGGSQAGVNRSLAVLEAMTTAPVELTQELERPFDERVLKPLQQRLLAVGRRLTGADSSDRLQRRLDYAGNPRDWNADRVVSVKVLAAIALTAVGFALGLVLGADAPILVLMTLGGLVLGFFTPDLYLYQTAYNRSEKLSRELPDAIDLLTISVESGLGFDAACQQVSRNTEGPLSEEFARMLAEMQIGQTRSAALRGMADRTNVPDVKSFVGAMVQADAFGIPIAGVLRVQSSEMRVKRRQRAETKAQQVPVKITVPLIFCILPCLFVAVMGPAALQIIDNIGGR